MNNSRLLLSVIGILCVAFNPIIYAKTASLSGKSYSLSIHDASTLVQGYLYKVLFTTYDNNRYSLPYSYDSSTGTILYSQELKKVGSQYKADYYALLSGSIDDYGELSLNLGNIDFNGNGIDDICEIDRSVDRQFSGNWNSHLGDSGSISGSLRRNAGARQGLYNLTVHDT
ncbi:MAG: hypothetical protein WBP44_07750 [Gammaproteobacteria bacterium]|jgi:hypothetical protein